MISSDGAAFETAELLFFIRMNIWILREWAGNGRHVEVFHGTAFGHSGHLRFFPAKQGFSEAARLEEVEILLIPDQIVSRESGQFLPHAGGIIIGLHLRKVRFGQKLKSMLLC